MPVLSTNWVDNKIYTGADTFINEYFLHKNKRI